MSDVGGLLINILERQMPELSGKILRQNQRTPAYKITSKLQISVVQTAARQYGKSTQTKRSLSAGFEEIVTIFTNQLWSIQLICNTATDGMNSAIENRDRILAALSTDYSIKTQQQYNVQLPKNPTITLIPSYMEGAELVTMVSIDMQIKTSSKYTYGGIGEIVPYLDTYFQQ